MPLARRRFLPLLALLGVLAAPAASQAADLSPIGQQIVVRHRAGVTAQERADLRADAEVRYARSLPISGVEVVTSDPGERGDALAALRADDDVLWAEANQPVSAFAADPYFGVQWSLVNTGQSGGTPDSDIDADEAWAGSRGAGVTVGVVDSGAESGHPDLAGRLVPGRNWVTTQTATNTEDLNGHGTHVSGIIAAAENAIGVVGIAPEAQVMPLRVLNASGNGSSADVAAAFAYAGSQGLRVVNASLGSTSPTQVERDAIATYPNTLFVVAAGNGDSAQRGFSVDTTPVYPCTYTYANILCVGASDRNDQPASFSNYGTTGVDLFAPGVRILSTYPTSQYALLDGTSMASPEVAAAAALVAAAHPSFTALQLKQALLNSVDRPGALAGKSVTGGRLNAAAALVAANGGTVTGAPATPTGVAAAAGLESATISWDANTEPDLAGYRVWRRSADGTWVAQARTGVSPLTVTGLQGGVPASFRVSAINAAGGESEPSPAVTVTPAARPSSSAAIGAPVAPAPAEPVTPAAVPVPAAPALPSAGTATIIPALKVSRLSATRTRAGTVRLRVTMSRAGTVTVRVRRPVGKRTRTTTRRVKLRAGAQTITLTSAYLGAGARRGTATVTVLAAGNHRSARVKLR